MNPLLTPVEYIPRILNILGQVDLDPCSHPECQVPAKRNYYKHDGQNGLELDWYGQTYCNPPWGWEPETDFSTVKPWIDKAEQETLNFSGTSGCFSCLFLVPVCQEDLFYNLSRKLIVQRHEVGYQHSWFKGKDTEDRRICVCLMHIQHRVIKRRMAHELF